jgi:hypothetical protein
MMHWLPLLGSGALLLAGWTLSKRSPRWGYGIVTLAVLSCLLWSGWRLQGTSLRGPAAPDRLNASVGYMLGRHAASNLRNEPGEICLIFPPDTSSTRNISDVQYETFARVLLPFNQIKLREITLDTGVSQVYSGRVPQSAFEDALAKAPGALVYISFAGAPPRAEELSIFKQDTPPPFLVYDPAGGENWSEALKRGYFQRVILPRQQRPSTTAQVTGPPEQLFREHFISITPDTLKSQEP